MSEPIRITDIGDPRIAAYARLTEAQLRSRRDGSRAVFLAESLPVIGYALDAGCRPLSFLMDRRHLEGPGRPLLERCPEVPVFTAEDEAELVHLYEEFQRSLRPEEAFLADPRRIPVPIGVAPPVRA